MLNRKKYMRNLSYHKNLSFIALELKTSQKSPLISLFDIDLKKNQKHFGSNDNKLNNATLLHCPKTDFLLKTSRTGLTDPSATIATNENPQNDGNEAFIYDHYQYNLLAFDDELGLFYMTTFSEFERDP